MSLTRVPMPSPNYSTRNPDDVALLVIHTAEGARDITSLGNFFANPANQVSSHAGADDTPDTIGVYVRRTDNAWCQAGANSASVCLEMCGFASWTADDWAGHPHMVANCAAWVAEESAAFGVPLVKLTAQQAQSGSRGVCQHIDLGNWGGDHVDCDYGTGNFPIDQILTMARGGPPVNLEEDNVTSYFVNNQHHVYAQRDDGSVVHWWMDLGTRPPAWRVETLPRAA